MYIASYHVRSEAVPYIYVNRCICEEENFDDGVLFNFQPKFELPRSRSNHQNRAEACISAHKYLTQPIEPYKALNSAWFRNENQILLTSQDRELRSWTHNFGRRMRFCISGLIYADRSDRYSNCRKNCDTEYPNAGHDRLLGRVTKFSCSIFIFFWKFTSGEISCFFSEVNNANYRYYIIKPSTFQFYSRHCAVIGNLTVL